MAIKPEGVLLPVTTPFDDSGGVDLNAYRGNLRAWLSHPISGVVAAGSTGEAPLLDLTEFGALVAASRELLEERALIAGAGAESTRQAITLCRSAAGEGADAVLVRPPGYYRDAMNPGAVRDHFTAIADASPIPVILYNIPKYVPVELAPELVAELVSHQNVVGIKDSSGDLHNLGALADACDGRADVLVGAGHLFYPALELGASGGVLGVGLMATGATTELYEAFQAGRMALAGRLQERIGPLNKAVVGKLGVPGVKEALDLLGLVGGPPRPPLQALADRERSAVRDALARAGLLEAAALA